MTDVINSQIGYFIFLWLLIDIIASYVHYIANYTSLV